LSTVAEDDWAKGYAAQLQWFASIGRQVESRFVVRPVMFLAYHYGRIEHEKAIVGNEDIS
jgi:hypothetical protein